MKVLIAIDAPKFGSNTATPRAAQWERTGIGNMLRLLATRIEFGQAEGAVFSNDADVTHALTFPDEWKARPWSKEETEAYRRKQQKLAAT